ncbi:hypothetical protein RvY_07686-2 [Ramazzottius varieornatus]|uniref:GPI inositol-deacylase n=1 Tax=Ramazzottius varieornatus TaxID=947166 RepID=A0A1D1V336_RAMVA|nr:hypothetical protein RvY_07686-2 [Ramazzottius varieornatus]
MDIPKRFVAVVIVLGLFAVGILDVLFNYEQNLCQMTYMFEQPDYTRIPLNESVVENFPSYGLYVYGEGQRATQYKRNIFNGIPVLFIPGNAGSFRQGRSIGSVLLRMAEKKRHSKVHFDVFTIDFDEEFSGLYGGFLQAQTHFVLQCLDKIGAMYKRKVPPKVVLIGHSLGGMIARGSCEHFSIPTTRFNVIFILGLFLNPSFDTASVSTIFTLSTPHRPIIVADFDYGEYFDDVNDYWTRSVNGSLRHVVMVSFAGGHRDVLVRSDRSDLTLLFGDNDRFISITTTSIPAVWASTDHLCIVWCKQLVIATARAIFDMVDFEKNSIIDNVQQRKAIVQKHFLNTLERTRHGDAQNFDFKERSVRDHKADTKTSSLDIRTKKFDEPFYQLYTFPENLSHDIFITWNRWMGREFIHVCDVSDCSRARTLTVKPVALPLTSEDSSFYTLIPQSELQLDFALLFEVPKRDEAIELYASLTLPWTNVTRITFVDALMGSLGRGSVFVLSGQKYARFNISLHEVWKAIDVRVASDEKCSGVMKFSVPGFAQDTYKRLDSKQSRTVFPLKLQSAVKDGEQSLLELFLEPGCSYEVSIGVDWTGILGQLIRFYVMHLPAYFAAVVILRLLPLSLHRKVRLVDHVIVNAGAICVVIASRFIPELKGFDVGFEGASVVSAVELWIVFYVIAWSIVQALETLLRVAVIAYSYPVHFVAKLSVRRVNSLYSRLPGWASRRLMVIPVLSVLGFVVASATCGENGMIFAVVLYFLRVCHARRNSQMTSEGASTDVEDYSTMLLLALLVTMVNIVPALVWTKKLPSALLSQWRSVFTGLDPDPSFMVSVLVGVVLDLTSRSRVKKAVLSRARYV